MNRNDWISVGDRLPKIQERKAIFARGLFGFGVWNIKFECWYSKGVVVHDVTHWQDLPEPPPDSADMELETILEEAAKKFAFTWEAPVTMKRLVKDIVVEIKAWKAKFP